MTELGKVPATSVPVIIREFEKLKINGRIDIPNYWLIFNYFINILLLFLYYF